MAAYVVYQGEVTDPVLRAGIQLRRPLGRLPARARDAVAQALWGHDFFPRATDYRFSPVNIECSQTLLAICRKK